VTVHHNRTLAVVALSLALACQLGCTKPSAPANENEDALLQAGLAALYTRHDPQAAATAFRKVLERNPTHYGATYQLATALDQLHKPAEAEPLWQKVLVMANGYQDVTTADKARTRLGQAQVVDVDAEMRAGLEARYTRHDPQAAVAAFRKVLELNPTHYGATYQLASALDATGRRDEAQVVWEKMLQMAEAANDQQVVNTARARIAAKPTP
jgi:cytochrome c-type biogenesis protein CcmH/NrfG